MPCSFLLARVFRGSLKSTPHNDRLTALAHICLHFFRDHAQMLLEIRRYSFVLTIALDAGVRAGFWAIVTDVIVVEFIQSDEKIDGASVRRSLCGVALREITKTHLFGECASDSDAALRLCLADEKDFLENRHKITLPFVGSLFAAWLPGCDSLTKKIFIL